MGNSTASSGGSKLARIALEVPKQQSPRSELPACQTSLRVDVPSYAEVSLSPEMAIQRLADVRCHLEICTETLKKLEADAVAALEDGGRVAVGVSPITIRTLAACLSELLKLEWTQPHRRACHDLCKLLDCPQQPVLRDAIQHSVEVLETTKCRFKSKELKRLRESLETLLGNSLDFSTNQDS